MDIENSLSTFIASIDFTLLSPLITAMIGIFIILQIRSFLSKFTNWLSVYWDKDLRVGSIYRFQTSTGHKKGVLTRIGFSYCRFRFQDHSTRFPNERLVNGTLSIVNLDPDEYYDRPHTFYHAEDVEIRKEDIPKRRKNDIEE